MSHMMSHSARVTLAPRRLPKRVCMVPPRGVTHARHLSGSPLTHSLRHPFFVRHRRTMSTASTTMGFVLVLAARLGVVMGGDDCSCYGEGWHYVASRTGGYCVADRIDKPPCSDRTCACYGPGWNYAPSRTGGYCYPDRVYKPPCSSPAAAAVVAPEANGTNATNVTSPAESPQSTCSICEEAVKALIVTGGGAACGAACAATGCEPCVPYCASICGAIAGGETNEEYICHLIHLC